MKRCFMLGFLCLLLNSIFAQKEIVISKKFKSTLIGKYAYLYEDTTATATIDKVLQINQGDWESQTKNRITPGVSDSNFWIKFQLENQTASEQPLALILQNAILDRVKFVIIHNQHIIDSTSLLGCQFPFADRTIEHRYYIHQFKLPKGTSEVYCLVYKFGGNPITPLQLVSQNELLNLIQQDDNQKYTFLILIALTTIFAIIFFVFSLRNYALFFVLQMVSGFLYLLTIDGMGYQYLWPNQVTFQKGAGVLAYILNALFQAFFILYFFKIPKKSLAYRLLILVISITFLMGILLILPTFSNIISLKTLSLLLNTILLPTQLFTLLACMSHYFKLKEKRMLWFLGMIVLVTTSQIIAYLIYAGYLNDKMISRFTLIALTLLIYNISIFIVFIYDYYQTNINNKTLSLVVIEKQNEALQNLLKGQETERKRLSQELHDGLSIHIAQLKQQISTNEKLGISQQELPKIIKDIDNIHQDVRHFSHALNPIVLEQLGFIEAVNNIIFNLENTYMDLDIQFDVPGNLQLSKEREKHFYHIIQELLNNTIKHAQANAIHIQFEQLENSLKFTYKDNGIGFNIEKKSTGIGLQNIKARTELLKGVFKIQNIAPKGIMQSIVLSN